MPSALLKAWLSLLALGAATTALAFAIGGDEFREAAAAAILVVAHLKSRLILGRYLGLEAAPPIRAGFNLTIGTFVLIALGLYLMPLVVP